MSEHVEGLTKDNRVSERTNFDTGDPLDAWELIVDRDKSVSDVPENRFHDGSPRSPWHEWIANNTDANTERRLRYSRGASARPKGIYLWTR